MNSEETAVPLTVKYWNGTLSCYEWLVEVITLHLLSSWRWTWTWGQRTWTCIFQADLDLAG